MKVNKVLALFFALIALSSCASKSGESASTAGFDLGLTGIFLVILGVFCNNAVRRIVTNDNEVDENDNGMQIGFFISMICGAIAQYITVCQGCGTWTVVGWAAGTGIVVFLICSIVIGFVESSFKEKKEAYLESVNNTLSRLDERGVGSETPVSAEGLADSYDYLANPIRKMSRIIGFVAFICIIAGGICMYKAWAS